MADAKFTPGPWSFDAPAQIICGDMLSGWYIVGGDGTSLIAQGLRERDAHLIAAAPDLYEAARLFVEEYDAGDEADGVALMLNYSRALDAARAALAKARGQ